MFDGADVTRDWKWKWKWKEVRGAENGNRETGGEEVRKKKREKKGR